MDSCLKFARLKLICFLIGLMVKNYRLSEIAIFGLFIGLMLISFAWRAYNLNYNTPFNDEAIYIVVGRMGVFQGDWLTYGAKNWMAGSPYVYPTMAALADALGGISAVRLVNVVFGSLLLESIFVIAVVLSVGNKTNRWLGGTLAVLLLALSPIFFYTSRLATYDMPGFYFLFFSLSLMTMANDNTYRSAKYYFLSAIFLTLSVLAKIIAGVYFPLIIIYSYWRAKKSGDENFQVWIKYFLGIFSVCMLAYSIVVAPTILSYYLTQSGVDDYNQGAILSTFIQHTAPYWFFWAIGSIGILYKGDLVTWIFLTLGGLWMLVFHLATGRWFTLDKHTLGSIFFLCLTAGIGLVYLWEILTAKFSKIAINLALVTVLVCFGYYSWVNSQQFNHSWINEESLLAYLSTNIALGDKVLAENGSGPILAVYENNFPMNVSSFDWLDYAAMTGPEAYEAAVSSGYFDYIQLTKSNVYRIPSAQEIYEVVHQNIGENYHLAFSRNEFLVYKRNY